MQKKGDGAGAVIVALVSRLVLRVLACRTMNPALASKFAVERVFLICSNAASSLVGSQSVRAVAPPDLVLFRPPHAAPLGQYRIRAVSDRVVEGSDTQSILTLQYR